MNILLDMVKADRCAILQIAGMVRRMRRCQSCRRMIEGKPYRIGQLEFCDRRCAGAHVEGVEA